MPLLLYLFTGRCTLQRFPPFRRPDKTLRSEEKDGVPIQNETAADWMYVYPKGIRELLHYIKSKYNNPIVYVSENGIGEVNNSTLPIEDTLKDVWERETVKGYIVWSFLDEFEWAYGYTLRYDLTYVDYTDGLEILEAVFSMV